MTTFCVSNDIGLNKDKIHEIIIFAIYYLHVYAFKIWTRCGVFNLGAYPASYIETAAFKTFFLLTNNHSARACKWVTIHGETLRDWN